METAAVCGAVQELRELLHSPSSRDAVIAMLKAYLDESGIHDGSNVCAVAGFVGRAEEWETLSRNWRRVCAREGVPTHEGFHMSHFENHLGAYKDWSQQHRENLLASLLEILDSRDIRGFGSAVVLADFKRLNPADQSILTHGHPDAPHLLCLQHCLVEAAHFTENLSETEKVAFVFDRQDEHHGELLRIYDGFRMTEDWYLHNRLADPVATANRRETPPLQAADLAAYETYKGLLNTIDGSGRDIRWPMKQLLRRGFALRKLTFDVMVKIANEKDAGPRPRAATAP
jgi:hypothetical protein